MSQSIVLFANAPAVVESVRNVFRPAWPEAEASIGQHEVFAPIDGRNFWSIQGPALQAYGSIQSQIIQSVKEREKDLYEGLAESSLPHSIDCFMVGRTPRKARPTIVISCSKKTFCKRLKNIIQCTAWWGEFINLHQGFGSFVLLPYPPRRLGTNSDIHVSSWACTLSNTLSLHGAPLYFDYNDWKLNKSTLSHQATCGQVLYLDRRPFGMTVAHASVPVQEDDLENVQQGGFDAVFEFSDSGESDVSFTDFTEPSRSQVGELSMGLHAADTSHSEPSNIVKLRLGPVIYSSTSISSDSLDWALIDLEDLSEDRFDLLAEPPDILGLCFSENGSGIPIPRPRFIASPKSESVKIFVSDEKNRFVRGVLSPSKSLVCLPGQREYLTLPYIILETNVNIGDCGKWIIDEEENWHGHILAGLPGTSIAYIAPAQDIMEDIKLKTKADKVELQTFNSKERLLWEAASKGDVQAVFNMSLLGVSALTKEGPQRTSALFEAARRGEAQIVEELLNMGAHVNETNGKDQTTALWISAVNGYESVVALLLRFNADSCEPSNRPQPSDRLYQVNMRTSPLYEASSRGHESIVRLMLAQATDSESNEDALSEALHGAASSGSSSIIEWLLISRPDIYRLGKTAFINALYEAACRGFGRNVRIMLTNNSTVGPLFDPLSGLEATLETFRSVLHLAVSRENETAISTLLEIIKSNLHMHRAREPRRESMYRDALKTALASSREKTIRNICRSIEQLESKHETWRFFLISVEVSSDLAVDLMLRSAHFDVNAMGLCFQHIMKYMAQNQFSKGMVLLQQSFDQHYPDTRYDGGLEEEKLLIHEVKKGDYDMVRMLLYLGYNLNGGNVTHGHIPSVKDIPRGIVGDTLTSPSLPPLRTLRSKEKLVSTTHIENDLQDISSITHNHEGANVKPGKVTQALIEMTKLLLPLREIELSKETPLSLAAGSMHTEILKLILEHGANVNQATKHWGSPLLIAARLGYLDNVKLLIERGAHDLELALLGASHNGHTEVVRFLINSGVDVHTRNTGCSNHHYIGFFKSKTHVKDQWTAVHIAVDRGHEAILKLLLDAGADANAWTLHGMSALNIAACTQRHDLAKLLLDSGAKPYGIAGMSDGPLHVACRKGDVVMVKLLLDYGAYVDRFGRGLETPIMIAERREDSEVIQLLKHGFSGAVEQNPTNIRPGVSKSVIDKREVR